MKSLCELRCFVAVLLALSAVDVQGATYYVRPDGDNSHNGLGTTAAKAWQTPDRGQPTALAEAVRAGQAEIKLRRAVQLPWKGRVQIKDVVVSYTGRTNSTLLGCRGVPAAAAGTAVVSLDWRAPQAGDVVMVAPGVYSASSDWDAEATPKDHDAGAIVITSGGEPQRPVVFRGVKLPIIDGRDIAPGLQLQATGVVCEGFSIRRGGIRSERISGCIIRGCRVFEGPRGIELHNSNNMLIERNRIFDLHGAWTGPGINLDGCTNCLLGRNTIVACNRAIVVSKPKTADIRIERNLIAWCKQGVSANGAKLTADQVHDNCLWTIGEVTWLAKADEATDYYEDLGFTPRDLHEDPRIVEWRQDQPNFLDVAKDSPCASGENVIGAGEPVDYPHTDRLQSENLVVNPGFESGMYGWRGHTWQPCRPEWAHWQIVPTEGASEGRCLQLTLNVPAGQGDVMLRLQSLHVRVDRGVPLTVSFRARCDSTGNNRYSLKAGVAVLSWHGGTTIIEPVEVGTTWQRVHVTLNLPPFYPHDVAVVIRPASQGNYWIDDVKLEQSVDPTPFGPHLEVALNNPGLGQLVAPDGRLALKLINRGTATADVQVFGRWRTPLDEPSDVEKTSLSASPGDGNRLSATPPDGWRGAAIWEYRVMAAGQLAVQGSYRVLIGSPVARIPGRRFFAATPNLRQPYSAEQWSSQCRVLADLGVGTFHYYLGVDRLREVVDDPRYRTVVDAAAEAGIEWLWTPAGNALFGGKNAPDAEPDAPAPEPDKPDKATERSKAASKSGAKVTPEGLATWKNLVTAAVRKYRDRVKYWEVLNEPNVYLTGDEYLQVLQATSEVLRRESREALILGGSVVNGHRQDLYNKTIFSGHPWYDFFSYHPYGFGRANPESQDESYRAKLLMAKADLAKAGSKARIYLTEEGMGRGFEEARPIGTYLSHNHALQTPGWGEGEIRQAQFMARRYVTAMGEGCEAYSYHTLAGWINDDLMTPNLALCAIHTMNRLAGTKPLGRFSAGPDYVGYLFQADDGALVAAAWPKDAEYALPTTVAIPTTTSMAVVNLFGNPVDVQARFGRISARTSGPTKQFLLGRELVYIDLGKLAPEKARKILAQTFEPLRSKT